MTGIYEKVERLAREGATEGARAAARAALGRISKLTVCQQPKNQTGDGSIRQWPSPIEEYATAGECIPSWTETPGRDMDGTSWYYGCGTLIMIVLLLSVLAVAYWLLWPTLAVMFQV